MPGLDILTKQTHSFTIRVYFPPPRANTKFNPIACMHSFFTELIKHDMTITVAALDKKKHLTLANDPIPVNKTEFKQFFQILTDTRATTKKAHMIIGCNILSKCTIQDIKFDKNQPKFMDWLVQEKIFVEADTLGITKMTTIDYLTRLHTDHTNRTQLKQLLKTALDDVIINANLAVKLNPLLKSQQTEAMLNGDFFTPAIPPFKVYKTKLIHGCEKNKVLTYVIGIKCKTEQARLLREFFLQLASPASYEKQIGLFIPTGAVHILGETAYAKMICDNNAFLQSVISIPNGNFQHATLDINFSMKNTDINQMTLQETIEDQPWCLNVECTKIQNKIMIITTKDQLETARKWINHNLINIYLDNIAYKLDITTLHNIIPRCPDKPMMMTASQA